MLNLRDLKIDNASLGPHHLEKLSVRIDGEQRMEQPDGFVEVDFDGLEVSAYESQGKVQFTAKAADIFAV